MGSKNKFPRVDTGRAVRDHLESWAYDADEVDYACEYGGICGNSRWSSHYCPDCETGDPYGAYQILDAQRTLVDLARRLDYDPVRFVEAVRAERLISYAVELVEEGDPRLATSEAAVWELLLQVLECEPAPEKMGPLFWDAEKPVDGQPGSPSFLARELACKNLTRAAQSEKSLREALTGLLGDPQRGVRGWAALQLVSLGTSTPELVECLLEMLSWEGSPMQARIDWAGRSYLWSKEEGAAWCRMAAGKLARLGIPVPVAHASHLMRLLEEGTYQEELDALGLLEHLEWVSAGVLCALERRLVAPTRTDRMDLVVGRAYAILTRKVGEEEIAPLPTEEALVLSLWQEAEDEEVWLIYSDWLEDQGQPEKAQLIRTRCEMRRASEEARPELEDRPAVPGESFAVLLECLAEARMECDAYGDEYSDASFRAQNVLESIPIPDWFHEAATQDWAASASWLRMIAWLARKAWRESESLAVPS